MISPVVEYLQPNKLEKISSFKLETSKMTVNVASDFNPPAYCRNSSLLFDICMDTRGTQTPFNA